jgi:hypothetical protein
VLRVQWSPTCSPGPALGASAGEHAFNEPSPSQNQALTLAVSRALRGAFSIDFYSFDNGLYHKRQRDAAAVGIRARCAAKGLSFLVDHYIDDRYSFSRKARIARGIQGK